jgi:hypothetical protein
LVYDGPPVVEERTGVEFPTYFAVGRRPNSREAPGVEPPPLPHQGVFASGMVGPWLVHTSGSADGIDAWWDSGEERCPVYVASLRRHSGTYATLVVDAETERRLARKKRELEQELAKVVASMAPETTATPAPTSVASPSAAPSPSPAACPAPPQPAYLPWGTPGAPRELPGRDGAVFQYDDPANAESMPASFPLGRRRIAGNRVVYLTRTGDPYVGGLSAWWQEGEAPCDIWAASLVWREGSVAGIEQELVRIVTSLPE